MGIYGEGTCGIHLLPEDWNLKCIDLSSVLAYGNFYPLTAHLSDWAKVVKKKEENREKS